MAYMQILQCTMFINLFPLNIFVENNEELRKLSVVQYAKTCFNIAMKTKQPIRTHSDNTTFLV